MIVFGRKVLGLLLALSFLSAARAHAQTAFNENVSALGTVSVGTTTSSARWTVAASSADAVALQADGLGPAPALRVGTNGTVGLSTFSAAHVDATGSADDGDVGLWLRNGNLSGSTTGQVQISFGMNGTADYRHSISSVHASSTSGNSIDFRVWTPDAGTTSVATMTVLSLVTVSTNSGASVHVRPYGQPLVELTVSNGALTGGGSVDVANQVTPSSRKIKTDIHYLGPQEGVRSYEAVKRLKPVSFRYMKAKGQGFAKDPKAPMRRGILYEEAPAAVRGPGESVNMDQRLLEAELAFQELARRLERLEAEAGP